MIKKEMLISIIQEVSMDFLYDPLDFVSYFDINSGSCGDFAIAVRERLPSDSGVILVSTADFLEEKAIESYGEDGGFSTHIWLMLEGKHFDIERPNGVQTFMELPYFQREIYMNEKKMNDIELYNFVKDNPENYPHMFYIPTLHEKDVYTKKHRN